MKKALLLVAFVLMVVWTFAQTSSTATDTVKKAKTTAPAKATPAPATNIATEKEVAKAPDVVLAEGNFFTGEVLIIGTSKIFLTTQENIFVWLRDNKAVEIRMIKPATFELQIKQKGFQVYDRWPMVLKVGKEDFLVYYFATSGGGYYGLPDGSIKKEPHMKQSGVVRSDWLGNKRGVEKFSSLRKLIEQYEKSSTSHTGEDELEE